MRVYMLYHPETTDWIWAKLMNSPNALDEFRKAHPDYKDYMQIDFAISQDVQRQLYSSIDIGVNRGNLAFKEVQADAARAVADAKTQELIKESANKVKALVNFRAGPEVIALYQGEVKVKEMTVTRLKEMRALIEKEITAENEFECRLKIKPIQNEIDAQEQRIVFLNMEIKEYKEWNASNGSQTGNAGPDANKVNTPVTPATAKTTTMVVGGPKNV